MAQGMSGRGHGQHAAQLAPVGQLAVVDTLDAVAERTLDVADVSDQPHEAGHSTEAVWSLPHIALYPLMDDRPPMRAWQKKGDNA